jgi:transcription factor SPT20
LKKFAGKQPSLVVHLHQNYFKFDGQDGSFPLDSPMKFFLTHLRHRTVPHQMMEELFVNNVPFYDGCLIVEVHNHRQENGRDRARSESAAGDQVRYSMHNYTSYITPSPFAPYPKKAAEAEAMEKAEAETAESSEKSKQKGKGKEGPHIVTLVLEPTELSRHAEMELLARTPASEMRSSKRSGDGATPSGGQPPTPHLSVPPTPQIGASRSSPGHEQKMCLEQEDLYQFQADVLLMTEPPLLLEPLNNHKALDVLAHPLHSAAPPSPKTRKRTTAEMAADDAQAAEAERRMLIMDERIKPSARSGAGTNTGDNAGAASTLGFSRFKTLTMVRERLDEQDRLKKDEEARAAAERKQQEEANAVQQQKAQAQEEQRRKLMNQRQQFARQQAQQQELMRVNQQAVAAQQAAMMAQHASQNLPQQNGMMMNQQQFQQHQQAMAQGSPVVRNQTPMVNNSSPMMQQNGFPMTATSSQQGINSPQRPASAAMPNGNLMARQVSQNQHASRNGTPQMQQGTPNMAGVVPNRQVSQTPRMPLASPGPGTPGAGNMQTPQQANMTPEQWAMLQTQRQTMANQGGAMHAGSPGQNMGQMSMTPEQIQNIRQQQAMRQQQLMAQAQASGQFPAGDPRHAAMMAQRQAMIAQQQHQQQMRQRMLQQQQQQGGMPQQQLNQGQAGSPQVNMQSTPNMNQAHLQQNGNTGDGTNNQQQQQQQLTPQQQQARAAQQMQFRSAQAQLQQLSAQYNGFQNIPQQVIAALPQAAQILLRNQYQRQQAARDQATRTQAMAMKAQQAQVAGQAVVGTSGSNPEYMAMLRNHQNSLLAQQAQQQQQQQNGGGMVVNGTQQGFGAQQGSGDQLAQSFAAAQHAFQRNQAQQQQQQQQGGGMQ